jgi:putative YhdH/YhfP family quinone oxidoreductase
MAGNEFRAFIVEEDSKLSYKRSIQSRNIDDLPPGDILVKVEYSTLNYKDALSSRIHKGITRKYPHTPGIDAAGFVRESSGSSLKHGDRVLVTGYDLGMNTAGGFAEYIRVPESWVVRIPEHISYKEAMFYGTAGFTAGIAVNEMIKQGITPDKGEVLVTGATGGVGTLAVAVLSKIGYKVTASTGKPDKTDFLYKLGASQIIDRKELIDNSSRPLLTGKWSSVIENVGGDTLSYAVRSVKPRGMVACIGNVTGDRFDCSIYPFILRGVSIVGVDSAERPMDYRLLIWKHLFDDWRVDNYESFCKEIGLEDLDGELDIMLEGRQCGKVILKL